MARRAWSPIAAKLSASGTPAPTAQRRTSARLLFATCEAEAREGSDRYALTSLRVKEPTAVGGCSSWRRISRDGIKGKTPNLVEGRGIAGRGGRAEGGVGAETHEMNGESADRE
jgi:hypothetical protein